MPDLGDPVESLTRRILFWSMLLSLLLALAFLLVSWLDPLSAQQLYAIRLQAHEAALQLGLPDPTPQMEFGRANLPPYLGRGRSELLGWIIVLASLGALGSWRLARPLEHDLGQLARDCQRLEQGLPLTGEMSGLASDFAKILADLEHQQQELNRATQAARQALRLREQLLSRSHSEFRQPLAQMRQSLQNLPDHPYLAIIERNLTDLLRLIEDLAATQPALQPRPVRLREFVQRSLEMFPERVVVRPGPDGWLELDELRAGQALLNLVGNALKYSSAEVEVGWGADWIEVRDFGPGIPEGEIPILMREFRQLEPGRQDGVGLGLATASRWMELQGGSVQIHSEPGQGTRARLTFTNDRKRLLDEPADVERA
ncbi:MAG: HAMP domain-containing sensor histidine kinase [Vulcanimicrobiota bacterium]